MQPTPELFVVYSFGFLMLGVVALIQPYDPRSLPISKHFVWLSAFGLIHGVKEALDAWILGRGIDRFDVDLANSLILLASYVCLAEFGRRSIDTVDKSSILNRLSSPVSFYLPLILLAVTFKFVLGINAENMSIASRIFIGFPGALLVSILIWRSSENAFSRILAAAFFAYSILGGLIVDYSAATAAFVITTQDFISLFGFPVQLLRTLCAVISAVCIVLIVRTAATSTLDEAYSQADRANALASGLEDKVLQRTQELEESEAELSEALSTLRLAGDAAGIGTWSMDLETGLVYWNETNRSLHGFPADRETGSFDDWAKVIHPDDLGRATEDFEAAIAGTAEYNTEYRVLHGDGDIRHLKANAFIVRDKEGIATRIVGTNYDLTEFRKNERELLRSQELASQAQKMEAVGQLTGGIAHDFNNLLAIIVGNLDWILAKEERSDIAESIAEAAAAADRAGELTKNLLAFARQAPLSPVEVDINDLVLETEGWLSRTIPANIDVITTLADEPVFAKVDRASLQSALVNLVINARDSMPDGGSIEIVTRNEEVPAKRTNGHSEARVAGKYASITICDSGSGISKENLDKIFDPFFTTKPSGANSGLGLSMVQGFVHQSSGLLEVHSNLGEGTSVSMWFPASHNRPKSASDDDKSGTVNSPRPETRVLLVDDQPEILSLMRRVLEREGYSVEIANTGDEALAKSTEASPFDLLITDVMMPGNLQGPALAAKVKQVSGPLPVIYMSGYPGEGALAGKTGSGKDLHLMKPIRQRALLDAIEAALKDRPPASR